MIDALLLRHMAEKKSIPCWITQDNNYIVWNVADFFWLGDSLHLLIFAKAIIFGNLLAHLQ